MTQWLYAIAFALWAVVVAARTNRQASSAAMTLGLAGGLGLKALGFLVLAQIETNVAFVPLAYLLPLSAIVLDSWLIWANVDITEWIVYRRTADGLHAASAAISRLFEGHKASATGAGR